MFNIINKPLGHVLSFLADLMGNDFAAAVAVFTLLINVILIPLSIKSQKSSVQQMRIKPKLDELKKKYGDDRQKMAQAQQELYQKEGVSMAGGCLPMLVRLILMMSIYSLILSPLTYMARVDSTSMNSIYTAVEKFNPEYKGEGENDKPYEGTTVGLYNEVITGLGWSTSRNQELALVNNITHEEKSFKAILVDKEYSTEANDKLAEQVYNDITDDVDKVTKEYNDKNINFNLFGIKKLNLTETPDFSFNFKQAQWLWVIPFGAFLAQIFTSLISMRINKKNNPDAPSMMGMMLLMPLISLFIGFGLPGGVGFYWICSSLIGGLIQSGVQLWYGPQKLLARERAKELGKQCDFETKQMNKFNNTEDNVESLADTDDDSKSLIKD